MSERAPVTLRIEPTEPQIEFLDSTAKFVAYIGGVGSGKSYASIIKILQQPPMSRGMIVAPSYKQLDQAILRDFLDTFHPFILKHNQNDRTTVLINGTRILWRSAEEPNSLVGANLNWFGIDEGCFVKDDVWKILIERLRRQPVIGGWITSTPNGFNWVYETFAVKHKDNPDYALIHATTYSNPYLDGTFVKSIVENNTSARLEQQLYGKFVDLSNTRIQRDWFRYANPTKKLPVSIGVDLAFTQKNQSDYTAIVVSCYDPSPQEQGGGWYVLDARRGKKTFNGILNYIDEVASDWKDRGHAVASINIESVAAQISVVQELRRTTSWNVVAVNTPSDKVTRFAAVEKRLEDRLIYFADGLSKDFEDELLSFPGGKHDDFVDATVYSLNIPTRRAIRLIA